MSNLGIVFWHASQLLNVKERNIPKLDQIEKLGLSKKVAVVSKLTLSQKFHTYTILDPVNEGWIRGL